MRKRKKDKLPSDFELKIKSDGIIYQLKIINNKAELNKISFNKDRKKIITNIGSCTAFCWDELVVNLNFPEADVIKKFVDMYSLTKYDLL